MQQLKLGGSSKQINETTQKALLATCINMFTFSFFFFKLTFDFKSLASSAPIFCDYCLIYRPEDTEPSKFKTVLRNTSTQLSSYVPRRHS